MPADRAPGLYEIMTDDQLMQALDAAAGYGAEQTAAAGYPGAADERLLRAVVAERDAEQATTRSASAEAPGVIPADIVAMNAAHPASPLVRRMANERGIALGSVTGTGPGGRVTLANVLAAAPSAAYRPVALAGRYPHPTAVDVDGRASWSGWLEAARKAGPEPTLFATGNLPPFTASGIDVAELMNVPWPARPALAAAPTRSQALSIIETCNGRSYQTHTQTGGGTNAELYAMQDYGDHPSVQAYTQAISQWLFEGQRAGQSRAEEESRQRWLDAMHVKGRTDV